MAASPQTENGHTKIANELLEAIYTVPLSDYEHRVFMLILRKTYGFKKKQDWISQKQIVQELGIHKCHISRTIKKLKAKNMITNIVEKNKKILGIQKDYEQWKLPKQVTNKVIQIGNKYRKLKEKLPKEVTEVTQTGNQKLPIQAHTKDTIQKKLIQNNIYTIFNYWNKKKIIVHKNLDKATESKINAKLKDYSIDEIKDTIHIYSEILKSDEHWFNYKWTLGDFLKKGFEKFKDADVADENYLGKIKNE